MQTWLLLALARPSTASTADAADLDVPSIAKEVAELVLWDLDSDFPYSSLNLMNLFGTLRLLLPRKSAVNRHCLKTRKVGTKTSLSNLVGSGKEVACAWRALSSEADVRLN